MINIKVVFIGFIVSIIFIISSFKSILKMYKKKKENNFFFEADKSRLNYLEKLFLGGIFMFLGSIYYIIKFYFY